MSDDCIVRYHCWQHLLDVPAHADAEEPPSTAVVPRGAEILKHLLISLKELKSSRRYRTTPALLRHGGFLYGYAHSQDSRTAWEVTSVQR